MEMAALRAALDRQAAAVRDRLAAGSAAYRAATLSSRSSAHQTLSRREDLDGLRRQLQGLEDDLAQALSIKLAKESKCELARDSISSLVATNEQLVNLVDEQRNKRDQYARVISNELEAVEALEAKNREGETWQKDIEKAVFWYQKFLGLQVVVEGEGVKFIFDKVDLQSPEKEYSFSLKFDNDKYTLHQCSPPVEDSEELVKELNLTNDMFKFLRIIRQRFQAATVSGTLPVSPVVCPDASSRPVSSPVVMSVDSRSRNVADQSHSQSKNKKQAPTKRRASALSAASPGSVRRSPRLAASPCSVRRLPRFWENK
ncbi:probable kinetochore protein SPC25 [Brachypodium distachyon]|uniref:Kinetochore protein SPC25 n=1 Tax=Brachypodium distachyon TaxID=15368 RepID=A0A0Q3G9M6_BRADI|nr:probable kinetochore protein SPC25 [Brachypodium distachyon]KQK08039.1 hypothetical protein BRADI_2g39160v3 [Brachypodium distachyon]|eukprot:XP_003569097.2 probable kinetochore protein SPC25 [Brachypodium distachyon]